MLFEVLRVYCWRHLSKSYFASADDLQLEDQIHVLTRKDSVRQSKQSIGHSTKKTNIEQIPVISVKTNHDEEPEVSSLLRLLVIHAIENHKLST